MGARGARGPGRLLLRRGHRQPEGVVAGHPYGFRCVSMNTQPHPQLVAGEEMARYGITGLIYIWKSLECIQKGPARTAQTSLWTNPRCFQRCASSPSRCISGRVDIDHGDRAGEVDLFSREQPSYPASMDAGWFSYRGRAKRKHTNATYTMGMGAMRSRLLIIVVCSVSICCSNVGLCQVSRLL